MVVGAAGVGKSWLVNRLMRFIVDGNEDNDEELDVKNQTFKEYPPSGC
jgi:GTPase SAR1 family protein